jgi:hypothetical protein
MELLAVGTENPTTKQGKYSRPDPEFSMLGGFPSPPATNPKLRGTTSSGAPSAEARQTQLSTSVLTAAAAPPSLPLYMPEALQETSDSEGESSAPLNPIISFLNMEESDADSGYRYSSDDIPILQRNKDTFEDKPSKVAGLTLDELVDRLLGQHMSKADSNFTDIFLCLYRKFAAPAELLSAILSRFDQVSHDTSMPYLMRSACQLRIVAVVAKWLANYPGDFASARTRQQLSVFIDGLSAQQHLAAAAQEMRSELQNHVVEDDDTGWARTDDHLQVACTTAASPVATTASGSTKLTSDYVSKTASAQSPDDDGVRRGRRPSETISVSSGEARSASDAVTHTFSSVEEYEAEARKLVPSSTLPLTKFRYQICLDTSDDEFADEITRIDWIMFYSIRIRDLVRHVSLTFNQKEKCRSLANVNRMIDHFNHVAKWVSNMILMRDKAKHRAVMLEKFMRIALKLRQLNNYNGLAAVIAGINGSAVHRLTQTRALVPAEVQKRFMRLELLMSTQKSHFAYRLAWENSSLPRIPFIPLHRRDLVSAEEGSRTFLGASGDRINWKKFEILAEVLLPIMRSQGTPYPNLEKREIAQELILDCRMPTDEEVCCWNTP